MNESVEYYGHNLFGYFWWFLNVSKDYMGYSGMSLRGKLQFWRQFPRALFRYYRLTLRGFDNVRAIWMLMNW